MPRSKGQTKPRRNKNKNKTGSAKAEDGDDERFLDLAKNPMFKEARRKQHKIHVDDRFKQMLNDERFQERDFRMDKRGKPVRKAGENFLTRLYEFDGEDRERAPEDDDNENDSADEESGNEEENEGNDDEGVEKDEEQSSEDLPQVHLDLARGEGPNANSSSEEEDEEESDEEDEPEEMDPLDQIEKNVQRVEWASSRLAICNMDWSKITAEDLMLVLNSFKPSTGSINSVSIYLSDFGAQCLEEEKNAGPRLKIKQPKKERDAPNLEDCTKQAIRSYEFDRLRYYYAVCECQSIETATAIYEACDGVEYGASGIRFDLRFIPDEMKFEENRLRDRIESKELNVERYKPKRLTTHSLGMSNPKITWEDTDRDRRNKMREAFSKEAKFGEFESLIASGSDEEEDEEQKNRYAILIAAAKESMDGGKVSSANDEFDEEEARIGEQEEDVETEEIKMRNELPAKDADEEETSDSDEDDGRPKTKKKTKFQEYLERKRRIKTERKQKEQQKRKTKGVKRKQMMDDAACEVTPEDAIITQQVEGDQRFSELFRNSAFAIDRTHAQYKGGDLAKRQVYGKMKRREIAKEPSAKILAKMEWHDSRDRNILDQTQTLIEKLRKKQKQRLKEGMVEEE